MLKQLTLKNFVLVDALDIDFNPGLTTITGESGAGKSILLNALGLLLGERARTDVIRPGADKADVSAEFDVSELPAVQARLAEDELSEDGNAQCLIRRVVANNGRSRAFINGVPVTSTLLRELGEQLVDIHGQNEHVHLANRQTQLTLLDDYAGLAKSTVEVAARYRDWRSTLEHMTALNDTLAAAADRKDLLTYQLGELQAFNLSADEFASLEQDHKRLSRAHHTLSVLHQAMQSLDELDGLRQAIRAVESIDDNSADLSSAQATLQTVSSLLDDAARDLRHFEDQVVIDPEALERIEDRLDTAHDLARKHRVRPDLLAQHAAGLQIELAGIDADNSLLDELCKAAESYEQAYRNKALALSSKRRKAAPKFAKAVSQYMQLLGITQGGFEVVFEDAESELGLERITFYVTTNPKFPAAPLTQIASGGEQTRIGLSIQIVAAENSALPCLILDEADVGVGGTTADTVGRILRDLGRHTQVICVTHAPQVAALGDNHYRVVKHGDNTDIHTLDEERRIDELARMLAGADITQKTREYAQSLLQDATH